ncbi:MAG: Hsp70 family protein [Fuerstiella sp.]
MFQTDPSGQKSLRISPSTHFSPEILFGFVAQNSEQSTATDGSRYLVGIDLGTTNCAVCYLDAEESDSQIQHFQIPQLVAPGQLEAHATLPSFHYEPTAAESSAALLKLPWHADNDQPTFAVGTYAREHGRQVAGRMVESAKSWLSHSGVDRKAAMLPWHGSPDVEALSPVQASARYLQHIKDAWNHQFPKHDLSKQDVVLTIPASFDEVARELTVNAARMAGLPKVILIEEPQAAFYSWVNANRTNWEDHVKAGQKILICDIGGGTSDFTLINVRPAEDDRLQFHRVAVGDHLILGGDNLDLALAHSVEAKLAAAGKIKSDKLDPRQFSVLVPTCRHAKEILLNDNAPDRHTITIPGMGSKLIGGSLQVEVTKEEVRQLLVEGFLPFSKREDRPAKRQSGFQEFGLPFAADAAITKYLAAFLNAHRSATDDSSAAEDLSSVAPDIILFNGGFFASDVLKARLLQVMSGWFGSDWKPNVLDNDRLDLAVARGAAYFGMVRRGTGVRIVAGLARTYYVGVETESSDSNNNTSSQQPSALCLISAGTEPGETSKIDRTFEVKTGQPVEFPIYVSSTRLTDQPSTLVEFDSEKMSALPAIRTVLQTKGKQQTTIDATLTAKLTEIGTLDVWCQQVSETEGASDRRWQLQFDVRSATETDREGHLGTAEQSGIVDQESVEAARTVIQNVYEKGATEKPAALAKAIASELGQSRKDWPPSLLRSMWAILIDFESGRRQSATHEMRWLNLLGFSLRPGFGMAADDWRVAESWQRLRNKLAFSSAESVTEWRILCRRIAGGLTAGQQNELASPILALIRQQHKQMTTGRGKAGKYAGSHHEAAEIWRMLGSLELLDRRTHVELGNMILDFLPRKKFEPIVDALVWALGRMASRVPVYGPLNSVLPAAVVEPWVERLIDIANTEIPVTQLALMQMARKTNDRFRDLSDDVRSSVVKELEITNAADHLISLVKDSGQLKSEEASAVFGEALPAGLKVR